jgi:RNA polymerase sigma factor (TIGR02999 family)
MPDDRGGEITRLLGELIAGKEDARAALLDHVYQQLHEMAGREMRRERPNHSWGATDLVHEAYLQIFKYATPGSLMEKPPAEWRRYFFGAAARAMRQLLVKHARWRNAEIRGGGRKRVPLDDVLDTLERSQSVSMEDLDKAVADLEAFDKRKSEIVILRIFGGLSVLEIAAHLNVSVSTVEKDWRCARTWLYTRLRTNPHEA